MPVPSAILNVDDHAVSRYARTRILRRAGFEVDEAATGSEALERVAALNPKLVLLDINLPDISGFEVCRRIKADPATRSTPVLHLTATCYESEDKVRALENGAAAYLTEPIEPAVLVASVRALLRERETEEALAHLAAIVESSEDAIFSKTLDGTILSWNRGAEKIYGYSAAEVTGRCVSLLFPPERANELPNILARLKRGERIDTYETVRVRKDGERIHVWLTISPVRDASGSIIGASSIARDISERKRFEEQLRQAQKLESLGVLAGGIAHDFNNLLTGILGNISLVLDDLSGDDPIRPPLEAAVRASERAAHLTRQMLAYAGMGRCFVMPLDLSEVIRESGALLESISKNVRLEFRLDPNLPRIHADPNQMQQLVLNLVTNGAEAIGESSNGTVVVATGFEELREGDPELRPGTYVTLEVRDSGAGMDEATRARIFDPFFTTKFTGRGLGLAAVSGIVRAHQGAIRVSSAPGQGTTFQVLLPSDS